MGFLSENRILKHFNRRLALSFAVIAVSTLNYGFDNAGYATTQAMEPFQRQFGHFDEDAGIYRLPPQWLSLFNSLNYIGFGAGVIIGSVVSARWGRRWCMFGMSAWAIVPALIAITSTSRSQILAGRILNCKHAALSHPGDASKVTDPNQLPRYLHWYGTCCGASLPVRDHAP